MKVLITSGGTKIPIDSVRSITNMSKGTFGAQITDEFWNNSFPDDKIIFLYAKGSTQPKLEHYDNEFGCAVPISKNDKDYGTFKKASYETFDDYKSKLFTILEAESPDIIILAAAVSDYKVENPVEGKIRTKDELTIKLTPLPKLISFARPHCPNAIICGFKLLVNSTESELLEAARRSIVKNNLDIVVANDLSTIRNEDHSLFIVEKDRSYQYFRSKVYLPTVVHNFCLNHYLRK